MSSNLSPGASLDCTLRRRWEPAALLAAHPPVFRHPHKRLAFELACPPGAAHAGAIELSRWRAAALPERATLAPTAIDAVAGFYDYAPGARGDHTGVWHVNFADPQLFVAYGSALLAQDELQALEHPLLGSIREALGAERQPALTEEHGAATPVLVAGVERRATLDTAPNLAAGRVYGLYGNRFAAATPDQLRAALTIHARPARTNLIAIAAPTGRRGPYFRAQLEHILVTAYTGFAAARAESGDAPVEIRTGFWGCGAFGGNRVAMTLLQLLAARLAGVDRVRFHASESLDDFRRGAGDLARVLAAGTPGEPTSDLIERVAELDYAWGVPNGT